MFKLPQRRDSRMVAANVNGATGMMQKALAGLSGGVNNLNQAYGEEKAVEQINAIPAEERYKQGLMQQLSSLAMGKDFQQGVQKDIDKQYGTDERLAREAEQAKQKGIDRALRRSMQQAGFAQQNAMQSRSFGQQNSMFAKRQASMEKKQGQIAARLRAGKISQAEADSKTAQLMSKARDEVGNLTASYAAALSNAKRTPTAENIKKAQEASMLLNNTNGILGQGFNKFDVKGLVNGVHKESLWQQRQYDKYKKQ